MQLWYWIRLSTTRRFRSSLGINILQHSERRPYQNDMYSWKVLNLMRDLHKNKQIPDNFYNHVRPSEGSRKPAMFYGRLKLCKESKPLRPVVSTCGTVMYDLAKWLSKTLRLLVGSSGKIVKNTTDLEEIMDEVALSSSGEEILMSLM